MTMRLGLFTLLLALAVSTQAAPGSVMGNPEQGGKDVPAIPEPMLFDMIRPLGAVRGELEADALATQSLDGAAMAWAPEVELAVADGVALELEMPMTGVRVDAAKIGVQATFGPALAGHLVHGVQYLGTIDRSGCWG